MPLSYDARSVFSLFSMKYMGSCPLNGKNTVTRLDVIFGYLDRVPLTHFVHRAKKVFGMWAGSFCWGFCATGIFRWCNGKVIEHRVGANLRPLDYGPSVLPLRHCSLVWKLKDIHSLPLLVISGHFCSYQKPNFPAVSGSYLPKASIYRTSEPANAQKRRFIEVD